MKILLVSATEAELEPFETIWFRKNQVDRLVSGVGMVATAHSLTRELQSKSYDNSPQGNMIWQSISDWLAALTERLNWVRLFALSKTYFLSWVPRMEKIFSA